LNYATRKCEVLKINSSYGKCGADHGTATSIQFNGSANLPSVIIITRHLKLMMTDSVGYNGAIYNPPSSCISGFLGMPPSSWYHYCRHLAVVTAGCQFP
jgi:hypothetical protein